jgi:hypothetical protein
MTPILLLASADNSQTAKIEAPSLRVPESLNRFNPNQTRSPLNLPKMHTNDERKLARKTAVYDHADKLLYRADREKARELMKRSDVDVLGTSTRIKALRFRGPDPALQLGGSRRRRGIGDSHRQESYWNVKGCWHLDRIPTTMRPHFQAVVSDCLAKAA